MKKEEKGNEGREIAKSAGAIKYTNYTSAEG